MAKHKQLKISLKRSELVRLENRFWDKVTKVEGGCWLWRSGNSKGTVPAFMIGYNDRGIENAKISRVSWVLANGDMPLGQNVEQTCCDKRCVNPTHLKLVPEWTITRKAYQARVKPSRERYIKNFKRKVTEVLVKEELGPCWIWSQKGRQGAYGAFYMNGITTLAHRASFILFKDENLPDNLVVRHRCDIKACVNPDHLLSGTHQDNMNDMVERGLSKPGEQAVNAVLTEEDVSNIKAEHGGRIGDTSRLAEKYFVSIPTINSIIHGRTWKHVEANPEAKPSEMVEIKMVVGASHHNAKLTEHDVIGMRLMYEYGLSIKEIAEEFGLKLPQTHAIIRRKAWKHVA